jgi:hypothetical protein
MSRVFHDICQREGSDPVYLDAGHLGLALFGFLRGAGSDAVRRAINERLRACPGPSPSRSPRLHQRRQTYPRRPGHEARANSRIGVSFSLAAPDLGRLLGRKWLAKAMERWRSNNPVRILVNPNQAERLRRDWYFGHAHYETREDGKVVMSYGESDPEACLAVELKAQAAEQRIATKEAGGAAT